jgi:hypothetical protein
MLVHRTNFNLTPLHLLPRMILLRRSNPAAGPSRHPGHRFQGSSSFIVGFTAT